MRELASCREGIDIILAWRGKGLDAGGGRQGDASCVIIEAEDEEDTSR